MSKKKEERKRAIAMIILGIVLIVLAIALYGAAINGKLILAISLVMVEILIGLLCMSYGHFYL